MKKLADKAINHVNDIMTTHINSMCATDDDIHMAAMACRIQELEEALKFMVDNIGEPASLETRDGFSNAREVLDE